MLFVENLTKGFVTQLLFEDTDFTIAPKERIGLVGRNGHGKTTLFRLLVGEEQPDSGRITYPKNYRMGYVRQHLEFTEDTVMLEGAKGLPPAEQDQHWKVEKVLAGLGFSNSDMQRHPAEFSGGFQVRLNLVKALVAEPDLLLLDEPTNYLDIASIRWIERFLVNWPHELILITHDRSFMDAIATHIMGIHRQKIRKFPGTRPNTILKSPRTKRFMKKPGSMRNAGEKRSNCSSLASGPKPDWRTLSSRGSKHCRNLKKKKN